MKYIESYKLFESKKQEEVKLPNISNLKIVELKTAVKVIKSIIKCENPEIKEVVNKLKEKINK